MDSDIEIIRHLYERFNARDIDGVLAFLTEDVAWANGMDGGHVRGREAVRDYWTRQWSIVDPHVEPVRLSRATNQSVLVEVIQSIRDLDGKPLGDEAFGLQDKTVGHLFQLRDGLVCRFDIQDVP